LMLLLLSNSDQQKPSRFTVPSTVKIKLVNILKLCVSISVQIIALSCDRPDRMLLGQKNPW
jgi:hypothetical protein